MIVAQLVVALDDPAGRPGDNVAGLIGFLIFAVLVVACAFLYRSMRRHLRKIDFDDGSSAQKPTKRSAGSEPP